MQLHHPGGGLVLVGCELGLQLLQTGLPVQRCRALAARQAGLQSGVDLYAFASLLGLRGQTDPGIFGAAVNVQCQRRQDGTLVDCGAGRQITNLLGAQLGLDLQATGGNGRAMGGAQALEQVFPTALQSQLQICAAIELSAAQRVLHARQFAQPLCERAHGAERQLALDSAAGRAHLPVKVQLRTGHRSLESSLGLLGFCIELHGLGVDAGLQGF
ncbi:hypothetical protein SDC9_134053 [bioreactor metagenome]|uniref:Uncharacterized protein n=1 Tax=bioreactor metagenome TaxID=1076179 RepID=A0A645DBV5_9ZZZZ